MTETPTEPIFVALAAALAAIEAGTIAEAEVESRQVHDSDRETILVITVRTKVRPFTGDDNEP